MKKTIFILSIFLGSIFADPLIASAERSVSATFTESLSDMNTSVDKTSSKRFKDNSRRVRRGKRTCLKKGGCSGKTRGLFKNKKGKCGTYY